MDDLTLAEQIIFFVVISKDSTCRFVCA